MGEAPSTTAEVSRAAFGSSAGGGGSSAGGGGSSADGGGLRVGNIGKYMLGGVLAARRKQNRVEVFYYGRQCVDNVELEAFWVPTLFPREKPRRLA